MTQVFDVERVLAELTLEEKASLTSGSGLLAHRRASSALGVPSIMVTDGPHGLRKQPEDGRPPRARRHRARPPASRPRPRSARRWDPDLVRRVGEALGARGARPGRRRAARPGRQHQAVPAVRAQLRVLLRGPVARRRARRPRSSDGIQSQGVGASLKHFAANNQETDRHARVSADVDERTLREIYLPAFERVVTHGAAVDGDVRVQQGQRHLRLARTLAAHRGAARRVGLRRARRLRLGRGRTTAVAGARRGPGPGDARRRPAPDAAASSAAVAGDGSDEAVLDVAARAVLDLVARSLPGVEAGRPVRRRRPPRAGPRGRGRRRRCC